MIAATTLWWTCAASGQPAPTKEFGGLTADVISEIGKEALQYTQQNGKYVAQKLEELAETQIELGDLAGARVSVTALRGAIPTPDPFDPSKGVQFVRAAKLTAEAGSIEDALKYSAVAPAATQILALAEVGTIAAKRGEIANTDRALTLINNALSTLRQHPEQLRCSSPVCNISELQGRAIKSIGGSLAEHGDIAAAIAIAKQLPSGCDLAELRGSIALAAHKAGDTVAMKAALQEMREVAAAQCAPFRAYKFVALTFIGCDDFKSAQAFIESLPGGENAASERFEVIASSLIRDGDRTNAKKAADAADGGQRANSLIQLAQAQAKAGENENARASLTAAKDQMSRKITKYSPMELIGPMIKTLISMGAFDEVIAYAKTANSRERRQILVDVINEQSHRGDKAGMKKTLADAGPFTHVEPDISGDETETYAHLATAFARTGDRDEARRLLELAKSATHNTANGQLTSGPLGSLVEAQLLLGDEKGAIESVQRLGGGLLGTVEGSARKMVEAMPLGAYLLADQRRSALFAIGDHMIDQGRTGEAIKFITPIADNSPNKALVHVADHQASMGHYADSYATARSIDDQTIRGSTMNFLLGSLKAYKMRGGCFNAQGAPC